MTFFRCKNTLLYTFLIDCIKPFKGRLLIIFLLSFCWAIREITTPYLLKILVDSASAANPLQASHASLSSTILFLLMLIASAWIIMEICMRLQGTLLWHTMPLIRALARENLLEGVKTYPYDYFCSQMTGHLSDKVTSTAKGIESLLNILLITFVPICSLFVFSLLILWSIYPAISLLFFIWMVVHVSITVKMSQTSLSKSKIFAQDKSTFNGKVVDILSNIFTMQTFCRNEYEKSYLERFKNKEIASEQNSLRYLEKIKLFLGISGILILILTLAYSYVEWLDGAISIGDMTFIIVLLLNLTGYLWYMSMESVRFLEEFGVIKANLESLILIKNSEAMSLDKALKFGHGRITVQNLCFGYEPNELILKNINFSVEPREKIALTGMSGSGKTTLMNLILGHLSLEIGDILIDDQNIKEISVETIRKQISVVPQNPNLFHRTIKENICYGKLDATDQEIRAAAKIAGCHDFILDLKQGYDTVVGEKGDKLSGGQKQRIAIARALLKNAPILIFDEPTSSLDVKTEEQFIDNLFEYTRGKTVILITHRISISKRVDRIIRI